METIDFNYFIERYISGEMEDAEKRWFEKELEGSSSLRKEFELRKKTNKILLRTDVIELRAKLSQIEEEYQKEATLFPYMRRVMRYASVVVLLLLVGTTVYLPNRKLSNDALFEKYYEISPVAGESVTRSSEMLQDNGFYKAFEDYRNGNFEKAIEFFIQFTEMETAEPETYMILGNSYAETAKYSEAGINYSKVIDHNDNLYIEDATWLLGLCYLKTGENEKAHYQMTLIADSDSRYKKEASIVLKRMKK